MISLTSIAILGALSIAAEPEPVRWSAAAPSLPVKSGQTAHVRVTANISEGWHLYSLKQYEDGPIATSIRLPEGQAVQLAGEIEAPSPQKVHDPNFGIELEFYEGSPEFLLPVRPTAGVKSGKHDVEIGIRYQTCNDKLCLPPKLVRLTASMALNLDQ